jgi:predicted dithiol-disulfide oxidoreductase (DUF899 family)
MPARTGTREEWLAARRGMDGLWGMYQWLDRTPRGRNDTAGERWYRLRDDYEDVSQPACARGARPRGA